MERIDKQFAFIEEIDKAKMVKRQTYLSNGKDLEDDAQHSWHLAMMVILLSEYANDDIDVLKTVTMVLIHDIVEIEAGDTYAYDSERLKTQKEREDKAANHLFSLLPGDQKEKFMRIWDEFEKQNTSEARFARTMDNIQPTMLNALNDGKPWKERGIALSQILKRNENSAKGSTTLWDYSYTHFIKPNLKKGKIKNDEDI